MKKLLFYIGLLVLIPNVTQLQAQTYHRCLITTVLYSLLTLTYLLTKKGWDYDDDPYYLGTAKSLDSLCFQDYKLYKRYLYKRYTAFFAMDLTNGKMVLKMFTSGTMRIIQSFMPAVDLTKTGLNTAKPLFTTSV
jgi:hypothetical protein